MRVVPALLLSALCASVFTLAVSPAIAEATSTQAEIDSAIAEAIAFAVARQDPATGEPPGYLHDEIYSGEWLASGYAAAGLSSADVRSENGPSLQDFLFGEASSFWDAAGLIAPETVSRLILNAHAAGIDTARVSAGQNLPAELVGEWDQASGGFGEPSTFSTAWGLVALRTTPLPIWALQPAIAYLRADQHPDGGWSFFPLAAGESSSPDLTAVAVGGLCAAGLPAYDPAVEAGLGYLRSRLVEESGAVEHPEFGPNLDTAAWTVNALNACGVDPQSAAWTSEDGKTPIDYILSLQDSEGGFAFFAGEPWFPPSTGHALRALSGRGFAVAPAPRQDSAQPTDRPVPTVAAETPVPHVMALQIAPGNVRLCSVTAPMGAPLPEVLEAARGGSQPRGCVTSFATSAGAVTELDGLAAEATDEAWLVRLDRGAAAVAADQAVGFGDAISLWRGPIPPPVLPGASSGAPGQPGGAGQPGPIGNPGKRGKRGRRGRPGRNATIVCRVRSRRGGKSKVRCTVKGRGTRPAG